MRRSGLPASIPHANKACERWQATFPPERPSPLPKNFGAISGTAPADSNTYEKFDAVTVTTGAGSLVKTGYNLAGWMTAVDGTGTSYAAGAVMPMGTANVTLYAIWVPVGSSFSSDGMSIVLMSLVTSGSTLTIPSGETAFGAVFIQEIDLIDQAVLANPSAFSSAIIPPSVRTLGYRCFQGCAGLTSLTIMPTTPPTLGVGAFTSLPTGFQLKVPAASVATYKAATNWITWAANIVSQ